ncbi:HNH endonuclease [Bradyrhizobium oligotrophicum]|uniref:HNH endonuclease n=1 Tax=Bradyrhizobium oligotrophicum TaxID=44255 RepID=UPI003EBAEE6F
MAELYLANTDNAWFDFLKARSPLEDVNFWKPTAQPFKAIEEGQLFVFRLKSPRNRIGGYGMLASSINVPIQLAWESLGERNGSSSIAQMIDTISRYRNGERVTAQTVIGCRVLTSPVFFEPHEWFPVPSDWSSNIVTGKVYSTETSHGASLFAELEARTRIPADLQSGKRLIGEGGFSSTEQARYGSPGLVAPRLGQGAFRIKIAQAYDFQCALSDTKVLPALEAAHIRPYSDGGVHTLPNGIFLRKDIHSVFDAGFATLTDDLRFHVSSKITQVFNNGNEYKRLHGQQIKMPIREQDKPSIESVRWHQTERYVGD